MVVFATWSDDPVGSLRAAVREELGAQFGSALLDEREGESLADTFGRWTESLACDLLLVLDQAEEYFLYHRRGDWLCRRAAGARHTPRTARACAAGPA